MPWPSAATWPVGRSTFSKTTAAHALSYGITKRYGVSHGHAVALTLGAFIEAHADAPQERLRGGIDPAVHAEVMGGLLDLLHAADGRRGRAALTSLMQRIGLEPSLTVAGAATVQDRVALSASVNAERLGNNPVAFTGQDLARIMTELP